jgi:Pyruvate/2-oxoacid:ferredoxin oxidoreductase gamma subunit
MKSDLVFGMAGSGGDGIVSAGESLIAAAAAAGYHGMMTKSFGSQTRGGQIMREATAWSDRLPDTRRVFAASPG